MSVLPRFNPKLHPRDRLGRFREVIDALQIGGGSDIKSARRTAQKYMGEFTDEEISRVRTQAKARFVTPGVPAGEVKKIIKAADQEKADRASTPTPFNPLTGTFGGGYNRPDPLTVDIGHVGRVRQGPGGVLYAESTPEMVQRSIRQVRSRLQANPQARDAKIRQILGIVAQERPLSKTELRQFRTASASG
jgi:hypothetical protein